VNPIPNLLEEIASAWAEGRDYRDAAGILADACEEAELVKEAGIWRTVACRRRHVEGVTATEIMIWEPERSDYWLVVERATGIAASTWRLCGLQLVRHRTT
jgi:hypothetical protein